MTVHGGISGPIFNLSIRWSMVVSFIPLLFFPQAKGPWYRLNFMSYTIAYTEAMIKSPMCRTPSHLRQSVVLPLLLQVPTSSLMMSSQYVWKLVVIFIASIKWFGLADSPESNTAVVSYIWKPWALSSLLPSVRLTFVAYRDSGCELQ